MDDGDKSSGERRAGETTFTETGGAGYGKRRLGSLTDHP